MASMISCGVPVTRLMVRSSNITSRVSTGAEGSAISSLSAVNPDTELDLAGVAAAVEFHDNRVDPR